MSTVSKDSRPAADANRITLELEVQNYTHDLLSDHVVKEYSYVINEWRKYINRVVDAEREAQEAFEQVLKIAQIRQQEAAQRSAQIALLALSLVAGPALSWIGGTIENVIYPRYFSTRNRVSRRVLLAHRNRPNEMTPVHMYFNEFEYNKAMAKVFGDNTSAALDRTVVHSLRSVLEKTPQRKTGRSFQELSLLGNLSAKANSASTRDSLRTRLENALTDEESRTVKMISDLALAIRRSDDFGRMFVQEMINAPAFPSGSRQQLGMARIKVESEVNALRKLWAKEWLYYGNYPPDTSTIEMARKIEREIWSIWILDQDFKLSRFTRAGAYYPYDRPDTPEWVRPSVKGHSGVPLDSIVVDRLVDLGVVIPRTVWQAYDLAKRNDTNREKEAPNLQINGGVNDPEELQAIVNWAQHNPTELLSGIFDRRPRALPYVTQVHW